MYEEIFNEINLHVIELPIELVENKPHYTAYLKELPTISAEGDSRQELYRNLVQRYQLYVDENTPEELNEPEEMTSSLLTADQLLKYYDGETFDGFSMPE